MGIDYQYQYHLIFFQDSLWGERMLSLSTKFWCLFGSRGMSHEWRGTTEPCQNDLLALAVLWDYNDHGQNQKCETLCPGNRYKEYSWMYMEISFLSMLNPVIGVCSKLLLPQVPIFVFNSWDNNVTWESVPRSNIEF